MVHELLVIAFAGTGSADAALQRLRSLAAAHRIGLEDACVAVRDDGGTLQLKQAVGGPLADSLPRRFWHDLVTHIVHHGRGGGPGGGRTPVFGLDTAFVRDVAGSLEPGASALFVVVDVANTADLVEALKPHGGHLLKAVLPEAERAALVTALEPPPERVPTAGELRSVVSQEQADARREREAHREARDSARQAVIDHLRSAPLTEADIHALLRRFIEAARRGETSLLAYRFPSDVCTDGGRAINSVEPEWPASLAGQPKAVYAYWRDTLRPAGYRLRAEVLDFPGGMPGDIGFRFDWSDAGDGGA